MSEESCKCQIKEPSDSPTMNGNCNSPEEERWETSKSPQTSDLLEKTQSATEIESREFTLNSPIVLPRCKFWTTGRAGPLPNPVSPESLTKFSEATTTVPNVFSTRNPPRFSSMSNLQELSANQGSPHTDSTSASSSPQKVSPGERGGQQRATRPSRYQRTRSFDDSYLDRSPPLPPIIPPKFPPGYGNLHSLQVPYYANYSQPYYAIRPSTELLPYNGAMKLSEDRTVFRNGSSANSNFSANSYIGYHQTMSIPGRYRPPPEKWGQENTNSGLPRYPSAWSLNGGGRGAVDFADPFGPSNFDSPNFNNFAMTSSSHSSRQKRSKWKMVLILGMMVIIIAVLIAMGVAVYSQVRTHNSVIKLVRQYRGYFLVTEGEVMDFSAQLLNTKSSEFRRKARIFERKLNGIFELSGLDSIYEGSEVTAFRFVVAIPAMEVHFLVKTKVNVNLDVTDLLAVMDDGIRKNVGNLFDDAKVDISSLTLENQKLPQTILQK